MVSAHFVYEARSMKETMSDFVSPPFRCVGDNRFKTVSYRPPKNPLIALTLFTSLVFWFSQSSYDPYMPRGAGGSNGPAGGGSTDPKMARIHGELDQAKNNMQDNIRAVQQRGETFESLQDKTGAFLSIVLFVSNLT